MPGFIRRFTSDPGNSVITQIEGVVIIDNPPPNQVAGVGTGFAICVAEFEDGPFNTPIQLSSGDDQVATFGTFGFAYAGVASGNPCARARKADGALLPEYWNGNGFIALVNKRFASLACVRVDTSVGSVQFTPIPFIQGNDNFEWDLEPAQTLVLDIGGGPVTATFNAAAATKNSSAGSYPTGFAGGEHVQFVIDAGTSQPLGPFDVFFTAADQSQAQVVARLNAAAGYNAFAVSGGNVTTFTGRVRGTSGNVQILAQDAAVGTKVGFNTTVQAGTGNVANIDKVTFAEVKAIVEAAVAGTLVERGSSSNRLRVSATTGPTIQATVASTATAFGFTLGQVAAAAIPTTGVIPAGTRVRNAGGAEWVTMQTVVVTAGQAGPFSVKVRPGTDDGSAASANAGTVNVLPFPVPTLAFSVTNPLPLSAALTEAAIDAAYATAIDATLNPNAVTKSASIIFSARQSNAVRLKLRSNVQVASSSGLQGRTTPISPPLGTSRAVAKSATTQPGVGAYRDQRVDYCFPGWNTTVPQIATMGLAGGAGFTADGAIDTRSDAWLASVLSQLAPEENPGQQTTFMSLVNSIEVNNPDVQAMNINDYIAFKAAGICAPILDDGVATFESGVTSVDPVVNQGLVNIGRQRMADFIEDSISIATKPFIKKKMTKLRRAQLFGEVNGFLHGLKGKENEGTQRIADYSIDAKSPNTPDTLALGIFRMRILVQTLPDFLDVVYDVTVGENVDVSQAVVQLAA